jgi:acetylornithine deacetylase/succinyl-diaminopimelate desuccinylase-like protein
MTSITMRSLRFLAFASCALAAFSAHAQLDPFARPAVTQLAQSSFKEKLASFTMGTGGRAVRTPLDSPLGAWGFKALKASAQATGSNANPVRIRMMGGSVPSDSLVEILDAPFVIVPLVNGDNNQHTFDENMRVGHYVDGIRTVIELLRTPY